MAMSRQVLNAMRSQMRRALDSALAQSPRTFDLIACNPTVPRPDKAAHLGAMLRLQESLMPRPALTTTVSTSTKAAALPAPIPYVSAALDAKLEDRLTIGAKLAQLDARKKELDAEIAALVKKHAKHDKGALDTGEYTVRRVAAESSFLDKGLLLKAGVKASVIEKATRHTPYAYPKITKKALAEQSPLFDADVVAPPRRKKR